MLRPMKGPTIIPVERNAPSSINFSQFPEFGDVPITSVVASSHTSAPSLFSEIVSQPPTRSEAFSKSQNNNRAKPNPISVKSQKKSSHIVPERVPFFDNGRTESFLPRGSALRKFPSSPSFPSEEGSRENFTRSQPSNAIPIIGSILAALTNLVGVLATGAILGSEESHNLLSQLHNCVNSLSL